MRKRIWIPVLIICGGVLLSIWIFFLLRPLFTGHTETVDEAVLRWAERGSAFGTAELPADCSVGYVEFRIYKDRDGQFEEQHVPGTRYVLVCADGVPTIALSIQERDTSEAYIGRFYFPCEGLFDSGLPFAIISSSRARPDLSEVYYLLTEDGAVQPLINNPNLPSPEKTTAQALAEAVQGSPQPFEFADPTSIHIVREITP